MTRSVWTLMIAPIFCSTQMRSMISGSTAALRSSVTPSARTAVSRISSVAPTLGGAGSGEGVRPPADVAAAQVGDERVAEAVQQRAAEQDRDAARAGVDVDLVDPGPLDRGRIE